MLRLAIVRAPRTNFSLLCALTFSLYRLTGRFLSDLCQVSLARTGKGGRREEDEEEKEVCLLDKTADGSPTRPTPRRHCFTLSRLVWRYFVL